MNSPKFCSLRLRAVRPDSLRPLAVVQVVVIEAQHGGGVGDERVGVGVAALGGEALPPKREVMRRMKVDLPQPESAARPMRTGPSRSALTVTLRLAARTTDFPETREPWNLRAARAARTRRTWSWRPSLGFVCVEIERRDDVK